jgi:hypothetical protein
MATPIDSQPAPADQVTDWMPEFPQERVIPGPVPEPGVPQDPR